MLPPIRAYAGRRQAWVKHYFLGNYIESLTFKVSSWADDFVYVDGFSGPWQAGEEEYQDTSFGIALAALRKVKHEWKRIRGRDVRMTALLVEKSARAFNRLQQVKELFPDIRIETYKGEFTSLVPTLIKAIPANAFTFVLIDPKGFAIDMDAVAPLISRPRTEVLFNFMFDFINRFALHDDADVVAGLEKLMPGTGWRQRLGHVAKTVTGDELPQGRKAVLVECFSEALRRIGGYPHVLETPVYYPLRDRTFYSLVYATRAAAGVEVFRDCQVATLKQQDDRRAEAKVAAQAQRSGQDEMFVDAPRLAARPSDAILASAEAASRSMMIDLLGQQPAGMKFKDLRLQVLEREIIRKQRVGELAAELRKSGLIDFPDWESRRRVPQDDYLAMAAR
ncbi:three-Cys-motif partner protein TcmP [uncultured Sphingomonas sp.]|uniref:three-Cys-motif partner protein TcmP n=1 Tax=uncultured Sphingomonas sp. TaxID=158754 RepID=UPI00261DE24D|nr:three-Cys-motif partner protein TcmP [uncultured Sphingomonas sp.]